MGYEDENLQPFVLDIETTARPGIEALLDAPAAPSNYKDEAKIAEFKADKLRTLIERGALDINLNRIVCFGVWTPDEGPRVVIAKTEAEERTHLAALGLYILNGGHRRRIISFNGLSFDLLTCIRRAQLLGLREFPSLDVVPAWKSPHTDLMRLLTFDGAVSKHSLDFYCRIFGIEAPETDDILCISGSQIPQLVADERWDLVEAHCRCDVILTGRLAQRLGVM